MSPTNVIFSTRYNFFKIFINDSGSIVVPATIFSSPTTILLATHPLGYIPRARVWYEPYPGQVWPMNHYQYQDDTLGKTLTTTGDYILTDSTLSVRIFTSPGGTFKFYWRIYADE